MESYLISAHFDLVTPDGKITALRKTATHVWEAEIAIEQISPAFAGFKIDRDAVFFNLKSTLAQLGVNSQEIEIALNAEQLTAKALVKLTGLGRLALKMLERIEVGAYIGKLFAADERRRVRNPDYLLRMFGRSDRMGRPLLSLGGLHGSDQLVLEKLDGRAIAYLSLQEGVINYHEEVVGFLPTLARALHHPEMGMRAFLQLHQEWKAERERRVEEGNILLVRTQPLHVRTVFAHVVEALLPQGYRHTSASILEPTTRASGDVYELYGSSKKQINDIPLEFYTLEPHREHVFFADRDQLQSCIDRPDYLFKAFETAPAPKSDGAAIFVVKGEQLLNLKAQDWIVRSPAMSEFPGLIHPNRQALMAERYIHQQPAYPFLKAIEEGLITSEGVLLTRYFPSPLMKRMLLSDLIQRLLKGIYFQFPSRSHGAFFSHEDRSFLLDLAKFAIPVFWADETSGQLLRYTPRPDKDSGMFVPIPLAEQFARATAFGIYGSNLIEGNFEETLTALFEGIKQLQHTVDHPLMHGKTPIALVTGGGPGVMEVGNRVAKKLELLSCANIVDFRKQEAAAVNEQRQNPFIDAKMTYRLDKLVERQAEFHLDFPIFLMGGIGTDFEYCLEEVRRKVTSILITPILLLGELSYWREKITSRFQSNCAHGTIAGSEWVSNCFYSVPGAREGVEVYRRFFEGTLPIGPAAPPAPEGFVAFS